MNPNIFVEILSAVKISYSSFNTLSPLSTTTPDSNKMAAQSSTDSHTLQFNTAPVFLYDGAGGITSQQLKDDAGDWLYGDHAVLRKTWILCDVHGFLYKYHITTPTTWKMHFYCKHRGLLFVFRNPSSVSADFKNYDIFPKSKFDIFVKNSVQWGGGFV